MITILKIILINILKKKVALCLTLLYIILLFTTLKNKKARCRKYASGARHSANGNHSHFDSVRVQGHPLDE